MRTEYDDNPDGHGTEQRRQKSRKERRRDEAKARAAKRCDTCGHRQIDHEPISADTVKFCHACTEKCPKKGGGIVVNAS